MKNSKFKGMKLFAKSAKYSHLLSLAALFPLFLAAQAPASTEQPIKVAAERPGAYLPLLYEQKVAVVANQTSRSGDKHLVDFLVENEVDVRRVFAPEHGFRGQASAGEKVSSQRDEKTGLPIASLYGSTKKPTEEQLRDVDVLIFDIQDVGARFYTYISTMTYVMEAAAENDVKVIVLDRPNPNGHYVDGPVLEPEYSSFVGLHPVPIVHGMTVGEYALMVNGEGWLANDLSCDLEVVRVQNYWHDRHYELPVKPSPNLPNALAVTLYPSLALFEGTRVSVGRGTEHPFQILGAPFFTEETLRFTPRSMPGAQNPPYEGKECKGFDLREFAQYYLRDAGQLYLPWLIESYQMAPDKANFFTNFFNKLAGNSRLQEQIKEGLSEEEIRQSWEKDLRAFRQIRKKYLLYD